MKITYVHSDVLGSTVLLTDENENVIAEYEYDVFGSLVGMSQDSGSGIDYLFTNQQFDSESELYYYNARYYNPKLGRFISRDPFLGRDGDVLSRNSYIYVKNNPLKYVDPTGEEEMKVEQEESWYSSAWNWTKDTAGTKILDGGQFVLDLVGLVPGFGEPADGLNALKNQMSIRNI